MIGSYTLIGLATLLECGLCSSRSCKLTNSVSVRPWDRYGLPSERLIEAARVAGLKSPWPQVGEAISALRSLWFLNKVPLRSLGGEIADSESLDGQLGSC